MSTLLRGPAAAVVSVRAGSFSGAAVIALLAMGMGARNSAVRTLGVPDLTTTVLTMTLTALAAELPSFRARGTGTTRRLPDESDQRAVRVTSSSFSRPR